MQWNRRRFCIGFSAIALSAATAGCGGAGANSAGKNRKLEGRAARLNDDPRIGVYTSIPRGFSTASYWIEGPDGLILIDTQFLLSAAKEAIEKAEAITGKKVVLAIVLHPNPDKFNGTSVFQARGIRVVTAAQVLEHLPEVHEDRKKAFYDRFKPDYPAELVKPDSFGDASQEISAGGVKVKAHVMGPGCSAAHVVIEYEGHVFVGDLVGHGTHAWIEIGEIDQWQMRLTEIAAMKPRFVHPGRGATGGPELLEWQSAYFRRLLEEVAKEKPTIPVSPDAVKRVVERMTRAYPELDYEIFLRVGMEEVLKKQAEKKMSP